MKKFLILLVMSGALAIAETIEEGSPQALAIQVYAESIPNFTIEPCPPERDLPDVQAACATFVDAVPPLLMGIIDNALEIYNLKARLDNEEQVNLEPTTEAWLYTPDTKRFERSYVLEGGTFRIIYAPDWEREPDEVFLGEITMYFNP